MWKKACDDRQIIVERRDIRSLRVKHLHAIKAYREEKRPIVRQMKLVYSVRIHHPMRGITGREQH